MATISASITSNTNNVITEFGGLINGVLPPGGSVERKIATGADVGAFPVSVLVYIEPLDRVDFFTRVSIACNITFTRFAFTMAEFN